MIAQIIKKIVTSIVMLLAFIVINNSTCWCYTIVKSSEDYEKYCVPHLEDYKLWRYSNDWTYESSVDENGKELTWYVSPNKKHKVLFKCTLDERVEQWEERSRYTHNGLNFELDRIESGLEPCYNTHHTYQIFGSKDRYQEVGQRLLKSVSDAEKRLKDRKEEIDLEYKLSRGQSNPSFLDFFVPYNKKAAVAVVLGTGFGVLTDVLAYDDAKFEEKKTGKKAKAKVPIWTSLCYIASNFLANMFSRPYTEPPKPYLSDTKYMEYYLDWSRKKTAVSIFYAALTGESKHRAFLGLDDITAEEKTLSGLPLSEAIEKFGFVLDLPYAPEKIWYKSYGDAMKDVLKNPSQPEVHAQNEVYQELVREFGKEFVETGDISKSKVKIKKAEKLNHFLH